MKKSNENDSVMLNGEEYIKKSAVQALEKPTGDYVVVRTYSAGVHTGYLKSRSGTEVTLTQCRRIWRWEGAATLSQVAGTGITKPYNCKVPAAIAEITLTEAIEIIPCTPKAQEILENIVAWVEQ